MATDFFERQDVARKSTTWLITMFTIAVVSIVAVIVILTFVGMQYTFKEPWPPLAERPEQLVVPAAAGLLTLLIIVGGTLFKVFSLRSGGGAQVAESLGGKRLSPDTEDPVSRRLLNVVEEMAIASGTPVPPVYLLDEDGINAFAAGYSPGNAVLGVTRGCATQLSRDELQGVIAHEFSHVLNGDMRMSIRLIGVLHGILLLGLAGQLILRSFVYSGGGRSARSSRSNGKGSGGQAILVILAIAIALIVIGAIGSFFGSLIKAAVSRQREYLADASAVQFTRNPEGIAGALKRIGASAHGSRMKVAGASEASHMYFAKGVWEGFSGLMATHPPLDKRIRAVDPDWDGTWPEKIVHSSEFRSSAVAGFTGEANGAAAAATRAADSPTQPAGGSSSPSYSPHYSPEYAHQHYAAELLGSMPEELKQNARQPYGARAVIYALLLDKKSDMRQQQWESLQQHASPDVLKLTHHLLPQIDQLDARYRLPLVEISLPALRSISRSQYDQFHNCFTRLIQADSKIDLFEWMLSQVVMRHLTEEFEPKLKPRTRYYGLQHLRHECSILLSLVSSAGNSEEVMHQAFDAGRRKLTEVHLTMYEKGQHGLAELQPALKKLQLVAEKHRRRLVEACAAAACADNQVTWQEAELLRGVADLLDCPMPPLFVSTAT
jgi:Zn-dependent protease with chaperone function